MTDKAAEQMARDTLNALIAGEYIKGSLVQKTAEGLKLDQQMLREIEGQLREYYSTGPYAPVAPPKSRGGKSVPLRL